MLSNLNKVPTINPSEITTAAKVLKETRKVDKSRATKAFSLTQNQKLQSADIAETCSPRNTCENNATIDIRPLKTFVSANYHKDSAIYEVIVTEQDFLEQAEFFAKVGVWLKLSRRIKN